MPKIPATLCALQTQFSLPHWRNSHSIALTLHPARLTIRYACYTRHVNIDDDEPTNSQGIHTSLTHQQRERGKNQMR
jgi:hypothetical protein